MLPFGVTIPATVRQGSEFPEGLLNNPVLPPKHLLNILYFICKVVQIDYQSKHYNTDQKDKGTWDDRRRDGGTNFILRTKEQETRLILREHDDDDDDDDYV
jgi:hypothetical protein